MPKQSTAGRIGLKDRAKTRPTPKLGTVTSGDVHHIGVRRIRILVVDDHPLVRKGLQTLLNLQPDMQVCGEAGGVLTGLEQAEKLQPDLVILDLRLDEGDGFELLGRLGREQPHIKSLVFTSQEDAQGPERAFNCGARAYVLKQQGTQGLVHAIRRITQIPDHGENRSPHRRRAKS